ncbi:hypothetical protein [Jeotgalibacillus campisalis]|uniref:GGDEF domain-containing protein n=1 Tax=Jeotgalibacillus campisalis TaxID=220754 RepID=A0A0C2V253_9BACL|nr:hypothetical protein [Jeotgalibacillus campisalis]KIL43127.1 hypothetical protein KR50_35300 [Jeotgalibacillus campisalis]
MKKNLVMCILILLIFVNGYAIVFLDLPFSLLLLIITGVSMLVMTVLHDRFIFLYAIILILLYGAFLTAYAFINSLPSETQLLLIYNHLLFTSFTLAFWILLNFIKTIGYENDQLNHQIQLLQKYNGQTNILTVSEFTDQATWALKSSERHNEEAWLIEIKISYENKRAQKNLQESFEKIALETIREKFDLVTSIDRSIYFLLKETNEKGVDVVLERYQQNLKGELNFVNPIFKVRKEKVEDMSHLSKLMEATT